MMPKQYLWEKFCKIFWPQSAMYVCIIRTGGKKFALTKACSIDINISVNISLWAVDNSNPRVLKPVWSSFKNLRYNIYQCLNNTSFIYVVHGVVIMGWQREICAVIRTIILTVTSTYYINILSLIASLLFNKMNFTDPGNA